MERSEFQIDHLSMADKMSYKIFPEELAFNSALYTPVADRPLHCIRVAYRPYK